MWAVQERLSTEGSGAPSPFGAQAWPTWWCVANLMLSGRPLDAGGVIVISDDSEPEEEVWARSLKLGVVDPPSLTLLGFMCSCPGMVHFPVSCCIRPAMPLTRH